MAVETKGITVPAETWTELSAGEANVLVNMRSPGRSYVVVGTAAPVTDPPTNVDYMSLIYGTPISFGSLEGTDKVYVFSFKACVIEVARG